MRRALAATAAGVALALAGCGSSDDDSGSERSDAATPTPTAKATETPTPEATVDGPVPSATPAPSAEDVVSDIGDFDPAEIYRRDSQGVVTIISVFGSEGVDLLDEENGGDGGEDGNSGIGSGFVLNRDGEIATNAHVVTQGEGSRIRKARQVFVQFGDGNRVEAKLRGYDPFADVALVEVKPDGLRLDPLALADSEKVQVGTPVAAMGSPFGEEQSLSVGVVSAVDRDIRGLTSFTIGNAIQTDAAINPGNSGGPLVNGRGEVIGLNQQIKTNSGGGEGVGFALPSNLAKRSLEQLRSRGKVAYAYVGVSSTSVYPQLARRFNLGTRTGAWVQTVTRGGPGARAGLRGGRREVRFQAGEFSEGGDVIIQVGRTKVEDSSDLANAVEPVAPGETVPIVYMRDGKRRTGTLKVGERPLAPPPGG